MLIQLLLVILLFLSVVYYWLKRNYSYWQRIGAPYIKPEFPLGNLRGIAIDYNLCELMQIFYNKKKGHGPFVGIYFFTSRVAVATDVEFVKNVMSRDFDVFYDRGFYHNERDDPLSAHLFAIEGPKWKQLRSKLTPTFTSGKMKFMFSTVLEIGTRLQRRLDDCLLSEEKKTVHHSVELEIKDIWSRYTTDVIGSCAFGIECNTLNNKNAIFHEMGRRVFDNPVRSMPMQILVTQFREIARAFGRKQLPTETTEFFMKVVLDTIEYRNKQSTSTTTTTTPQRNDFMTILLNLKKQFSNGNTNNVIINSKTIMPPGDHEFTTDEIAAQAFVFFIAGFETSSTLLTFCSYELCMNEDIQERLRQSIKDVLKKYDGQFTYEAMMEMTYLDQVLNEALRKYPPLANLTRKSVCDYKVPGTNLIIPAGTTVMIPVYAIHRDPEHYPDPEKFDPERFSKYEMNKRNPFTFLPFGEGPRICIGLRFGMMQARIGLAMVLLKYRLRFSNKMASRGEMALSKKHFIIAIEGGLWLNLEKID